MPWYFLKSIFFTAHNFVKSCKQRLKQWIGDEDPLFQQLGECLYTVQSFYSNTNWVEMYGSVPYEDFGMVILIMYLSVQYFERACRKVLDQFHERFLWQHPNSTCLPPADFYPFHPSGKPGF